MWHCSLNNWGLLAHPQRLLEKCRRAVWKDGDLVYCAFFLALCKKHHSYKQFCLLYKMANMITSSLSKSVLETLALLAVIVPTILMTEYFNKGCIRLEKSSSSSHSLTCSSVWKQEEAVHYVILPCKTFPLSCTFWSWTPWLHVILCNNSSHTEIVTGIVGSALASWFPQFLPAWNPPNLLSSIECFGKESHKTAQVINFCLKDLRCCLLPFWDTNKDKCTTKGHWWLFSILEKCRWKWPWQLLILPEPKNLCIYWLCFDAVGI